MKLCSKTAHLAVLSMEHAGAPDVRSGWCRQACTRHWLIVLRTK